MKKQDVKIAAVIIVFITLFIILIDVDRAEEKEHIEKVSSDCLKQGKSIVKVCTSYDCYYKCKK